MCQDAANNTTFTGPDDVWGNGNATNRETGCVDAFYSAEMERQMLSSWLGRNGMNGSGGWVPIRVGLNDVNAYYDGTQVQIGHSQGSQLDQHRWTSSAHEFGHGIDDRTPGGISRRRHPGVRGRHLRRGHRVLRQQPRRTLRTT